MKNISIFLFEYKITDLKKYIYIKYHLKATKSLSVEAKVC